MNKHIELVKKWLEDPESVSQEELEANSEAACDAYDAAPTFAAYAADAVDIATYAARAANAANADDATYWVKQYEEITK